MLRKTIAIIVALSSLNTLQAAKSDGCPRLAKPRKPPIFVYGLFDGARRSDIGFALEGIGVTRDLTAESRGDPKISAGLDGTWFVRAPEPPEPLTEIALEVRFKERGRPILLRLHRLVDGESEPFPVIPPGHALEEKPIRLYASQSQPVRYDAAPHPDTPLNTKGLRSGTRVHLTLLTWVGDRILRVKLPPVALKVLRAVK